VRGFLLAASAAEGQSVSNGVNRRVIACYREAKLYSRRLYRAVLEPFNIDKSYVDRLRDGEPPTEQHFVTYFGQLLGIMLRARYLPQEKVHDVRQETLTRVIAILRREGGAATPSGLTPS